MLIINFFLESISMAFMSIVRFLIPKTLVEYVKEHYREIERFSQETKQEIENEKKGYHVDRRNEFLLFGKDDDYIEECKRVDAIFGSELHIIYDNDQKLWKAVCPKRDEVFGEKKTKKDISIIARSVAKKYNMKLIVHRKNGSIAKK